MVTDLLGVNASDVSVGLASTAMTSSLTCLQTSITQVDCTISIDSSGDITIQANNTSGQAVSSSESGYVIDTIAPDVPVVHVDTATGVDSPTITFSTSDNVAVDYYEIDYIDASGASVTLSPASSPVQLSLFADEITNPPYAHTITVRAYDTAGNMSENMVSFPPIVSFTTPTTISNAPITNATVTITSPASNPLENIVLTPSTTGASLGDCTDASGNTTEPYDSPVTCIIQNITASGTINVAARDSVTTAVGDSQVSFVIETNSPSIAITAPDKLSNNAITTTTVAIIDDYAINASDITIQAVNGAGGFSISNINCTQTNASRVDCTLQIDGSEGTGGIRVSAVDRADNTISKVEGGYEIDTTAPSVTVEQAVDQPDPTNIDSISYLVVFSESITNFDENALVLNGSNSAVIDAIQTIDTVSYRVTIRGMLDGETIKLSVVPSGFDPAGNENTASTSVDNSVTYDISPPDVVVTTNSMSETGG